MARTGTQKDAEIFRGVEQTGCGAAVNLPDVVGKQVKAIASAKHSRLATEYAFVHSERDAGDDQDNGAIFEPNFIVMLGRPLLREVWFPGAPVQRD